MLRNIQFNDQVNCSKNEPCLSKTIKQIHEYFHD